uniref:Reverse transcriptase n=1 Tax=Haemonchus contortus TaxID=6289 RepID=A0A7I4YMX6_HAECO
MRRESCEVQKRSIKIFINRDHFASFASLWKNLASGNIDKECNRIIMNRSSSSNIDELDVSKPRRRYEERPTIIVMQRETREAWGAFRDIEEVVKKTKNIRLRSKFQLLRLRLELYESRLCMRLASFYALRQSDARNFPRHEVQEGIWSSVFRHRTKIRDAVNYAKESEIRWTGTYCGIVMAVGPGR